MSEPNDQGEGEIHHVLMTVCHFQHNSMPGVDARKIFSGFKMGPLCNAAFACVLRPRPFLARNEVIYGRGTQQCFLDDLNLTSFLTDYSTLGGEISFQSTLDHLLFPSVQI